MSTSLVQAADSTLDWASQTATNLETGNLVSTVDGVTITTSATKIGGRDSDTIAVQPTTTSNGATGIVASAVDAVSDDETVSNVVTFSFSEPVYDLTFEVRDIDSSNGSGSFFTDLIVFSSDGGLPTSPSTGPNVTYTPANGRAISNQLTNCQAANANLCVVTVNFTGPVQSVSVSHVSAQVIGSTGTTNTTNQAIQIDDLTFNTPPDATNNTASTAVGLSSSGNVITDNDGNGTDSDRQDAALLVNQISHPTGGTSSVGPTGTTLTLANGATLIIAQDGSYTFNTNGAYSGLASGTSATETFTYRIEDQEGLFDTGGDVPNPDSVATLTVTITNAPTPSFTIEKDVDQASITSPGTLNYTITIVNDGNVDLTGTSFNDTLTLGGAPRTLTTPPTLSGDTNGNNILETTETWIYTATYDVTQADLDTGDNLTNVATFNSAELGPNSDTAITTTPGPVYSCGNDDFVDREEVFGTSGFVDCSTAGFSGEAGEQAPGNVGTLESGWFEWTAPVTGVATFDTCDTSVTGYDTYLAVYTAAGTPAVNALTLEGSNDDGPGCSAFSSLINFNAIAGETYYIQVDGYLGNDGDYRLRWNIDDPSVAVTKSVDQTEVSAPDTLTYTIIVDNDGSVDLNSVNLTDLVTQDGTSVSPTTGPTLTSGDDGDGVLETNETWIYTATYDVTAANITNQNDIVNNVDVTSTEITTAVSASATTSVSNPSLMISKSAAFVTGSAPASVGDVIRYSYAVENIGNQIITDVSVSDITNGTDPAFLGGANPGNPDHEAALTTDSGPATGDSPDNNPSATVWGTLAPGDVITFQADYTVTQTDIDTLQ